MLKNKLSLITENKKENTDQKINLAAIQQYLNNMKSKETELPTNTNSNNKKNILKNSSDFSDLVASLSKDRTDIMNLVKENKTDKSKESSNSIQKTQTSQPSKEISTLSTSKTQDNSLSMSSLSEIEKQIAMLKNFNFQN